MTNEQGLPVKGWPFLLGLVIGNVRLFFGNPMAGDRVAKCQNDTLGA